MANLVIKNKSSETPSILTFKNKGKDDVKIIRKDNLIQIKGQKPDNTNLEDYFGDTSVELRLGYSWEDSENYANNDTFFSQNSYLQLSPGVIRGDTSYSNTGGADNNKYFSISPDGLETYYRGESVILDSSGLICGGETESFKITNSELYSSIDDSYTIKAKGGFNINTANSVVFNTSNLQQKSDYNNYFTFTTAYNKANVLKFQNASYSWIMQSTGQHNTADLSYEFRIDCPQNSINGENKNRIIALNPKGGVAVGGTTVRTTSFASYLPSYFDKKVEINNFLSVGCSDPNVEYGAAAATVQIISEEDTTAGLYFGHNGNAERMIRLHPATYNKDTNKNQNAFSVVDLTFEGGANIALLKSSNEVIFDGIYGSYDIEKDEISPYDGTGFYVLGLGPKSSYTWNDIINPNKEMIKKIANGETGWTNNEPSCFDLTAATMKLYPVLTSGNAHLYTLSLERGGTVNGEVIFDNNIQATSITWLGRGDDGTIPTWQFATRATTNNTENRFSLNNLINNGGTAFYVDMINRDNETGAKYNFTFNGQVTIGGIAQFNSNLIVKDGKITILGGNTSIKGTLTTTEKATFNGDVVLNKALAVGGTVQLNNTLTVKDGKATTLGGNATIKGNLTAYGLSKFYGVTHITHASNRAYLYLYSEVNVPCDLCFGSNNVPTKWSWSCRGTDDTIGDSALILYNASLGSYPLTFTKEGAILVKAPQNLSLTQGNFINSGTTTLNNTLTVGNYATTLGGTLKVTGATTLAALTATSVTLSSTLDVTGATTLKNGLTVSNSKATSLTGALNVTGGTTLSSTLKVTGKSTLGDTEVTTLKATSTATFDSALNVNGYTSLKQLSVNNNANFYSSVTFSSTAEFDNYGIYVRDAKIYQEKYENGSLNYTTEWLPDRFNFTNFSDSGSIIFNGNRVDGKNRGGFDIAINGNTVLEINDVESYLKKALNITGIVAEEQAILSLINSATDATCEIKMGANSKPLWGIRVRDSKADDGETEQQAHLGFGIYNYSTKRSNLLITPGGTTFFNGNVCFNDQVLLTEDSYGTDLPSASSSKTGRVFFKIIS